MAYKLISEKWSANCGDYIKEFICDTDAGFAHLPEACPGSTAVSLASGAIRVVNTVGEWVAFAEEG